MKTSRLIRFVICWFSFISFWGASSAQTDTLTIIGEIGRHDTTDRVRILRDFNWNVRARHLDGKITNYSGARVDTFLSMEDLDTVYLSTDIVVADVNLNQLLYMQYKVEGSLLGKVDSLVFANTGKFGRSREERRQSREDYAAFLFRKAVTHLEIIYLPSYTHDFDLRIGIVQRDAAEMSIKEKQEDDARSYARGFYYLAFGIVFLAIFAFSKEKREHLYFALFCFFAACAFTWDQFHIAYFDDIHVFFGILCFEFLSMFFSKILKNKEKSKVPLMIMTGIFLLSFVPPIRSSIVHGPQNIKGSLYIFGVSVVFYPYVWLASIVYLVQGIGQKRWEARAILVTCLVPLVAYLLLLFGIIIFAAIDVKTVQNDFTGKLIEQFVAAIIYIYPLAPVFILARRNSLNHRQLTAQLKSIQHLSEENVAKEKEKKEILERQNEVLEREVEERTAEIVDQKDKIEKQHDELKIEKEKSDELLRNILPAEVAEELKQTGFSAARHFENVTVLFADFVNFTTTGSELTPQALVSELDVCFRAFDQIMVERGIEKIKTIGDAYLAVCGLPLADTDHALKALDAAKAILRFMEERAKDPANRMVRVRIGVHTGSVVAGIVGVKKFAYDIWGDTVNTAARMQQASDPGKINISQATFERVSERYSCTSRGLIEVKGKGAMEMYFVD